MKPASGRDWQALVMGSPSSTGTGSSAPANWIGVSADLTAPADTDTVLAGEITVGGLARKQAIFGRTSGATNYTLSATFTATNLDALPVRIHKLGVTNGALPSATLAFASPVPEDILVQAVGDAFIVTETISL